MADFQFTLIDDGNPSIYETPVLFKKDSVGKVRTWRMQLDDTGRYRTLAGLLGGKQAESGWTTPVPASCSTQKEQGEFEVRAAVKHQLDREYRLTEAELATVGAEFVQPMLAKTYDKWPGIGYAQPKLDGIRCIMTAAGMFTRQGQPIVAVPHLHAQLQEVFAEYPDLICDGELYSHDSREDFGTISSIVRKKNPTTEQFELAEKVMQYWVYDLVDPSLTFAERSNLLKKLLAAHQGDIVIVPTGLCLTQQDADDFYGEAVSQGYEGGMYRLDKPYELGRRSKTLLKRKEFKTEEFKLVGLEEGRGNWAGAIKRGLLETADGQPFGAGIRGSYAAGKAMLDVVLSPNAVATVRYFMLSPYMIPRFPVIIDIHPDGRKD